MKDMPLALFKFRSLAIIMAASLSVLAAPPALSQDKVSVLAPVARLNVTGSLTGKKGKAAKDISGMACVPDAGPEKLCLLINDENTEAQFVRIRDKVLTPAAMVPLIGQKAPASAVGAAPSITCSGVKKFADLDGEAVAYENRQFFVTGSHGCSRNSDSFRLSAFYLARISLAGAGEAVKSIELSYRMSDVLVAAAQAGGRFGKPLDMAGNGLNIEGLAISGGKLWAGLRAPVDGGRAYLIGAPVDELFAPGIARWQGAPDVRVLALGAGRGIRDLASLSAGRLLLLSGPAQDQDIDYRLHLVDLNTSAPSKLIGAIEKVKGGKAEVVAVLRESEDALEFVVMFDSVVNGGGLLYRVKLP